MHKRADAIIGDSLSKEKAADKIAGDMKLMRDLFLDAVGPQAAAVSTPVTGSPGNSMEFCETLKLMKSDGIVRPWCKS